MQRRSSSRTSPISRTELSREGGSRRAELQGADPLRRPVRRERAAYYPRNRNRAPVAAVVALAAVVAHQEDVAARYADGLRETTRAAAPASLREGLGRALP